MTREVIEVTRRELAVITAPQPSEQVVVELMKLELVEVAKQGDPGPPGPPGESEAQQYDTDLALLFEIAMLP